MPTKKIIINFCPNGMVPTKKHSVHVPESPHEIIEQVHEAYELGITIAHIHARGDDGLPTYRSAVYGTIFDGLRKYCPGLVLCGSASGRDWAEFEKRAEVLEVGPDMCSLTLSSQNFAKQAAVNSPDMIQRLAEKMEAYGVTPELECFDLGMINYGNYLIRKKLVKGPFYWNLIFGNIAGFQFDLQHISTAVHTIPPDHLVAFAGLAGNQLPVNALAIAAGYGVRVGLEDNLWFDSERKKLARNMDLLKRIHTLIKINGHSLMSCHEFGQKGFYNTHRAVKNESPH